MLTKLVFRAVLDFLYGASFYGASQELRQQQAELNAVFMLLILGNSLGVPVFPPISAQRLLPYLLPQLNSWKRAILRPKGLQI